MDPTDLSDDELDQLANELAGRLPTGTHGDRVVLSRRQALGALTGTIGSGALLALGVDPAVAQAAGQQGTESSPNDMFAYNLDVENGADFNSSGITNLGSLNAGGPLSDGDGTERQIWVIANGASDPSGADGADLIFEEEA